MLTDFQMFDSAFFNIKAADKLYYLILCIPAFSHYFYGKIIGYGTSNENAVTENTEPKLG